MLKSDVLHSWCHRHELSGCFHDYTTSSAVGHFIVHCDVYTNPSNDKLIRNIFNNQLIVSSPLWQTLADSHFFFVFSFMSLQNFSLLTFHKIRETEDVTGRSENVWRAFVLIS